MIKIGTSKEEKKSQKKNPFLAAGLSFIIPGLGHFYLRLWKSGIQLLGTYFILIFLNVLSKEASLILYLGVLFISIGSAVHAFKQAKKLNAPTFSQPSVTNKSKKAKIIFAVIMFFAILVGSYLLSNAPDTTILGKNIQLLRIVFNDKSSPNGYLNVPFLKDSTKYEFINIVVDFNQDGKFERYPISNGYQEEWVVQNMAVKTLKDQSNSFSIVMPDQDIDGRRDFEVRVVLSKKTLEDWNNWNTADAFHRLKIAQVQKENAGKYYQPDPEGIRSGGLPFGAVASTNRVLRNVLPSKEIPSEMNTLIYFVYAASDLFNVFRGDVPDINQGLNECVPTSATNALLWLAEHYGFKDKIPSSTNIINELEQDLGWNERGGVVVPQNYLSGMKKFAEDHNLPLQSYKVGQDYDTTIVSKIADELTKGNLVVLDMEYISYDDAGNPVRAGGHMVTVVGASDTENGQYLYINDPLSQIPGVDVYKVENGKVLNYRFQADAQTVIRSAIAEASTVPVVKPIDSSTAPQQSPQERTPSQAQPGPAPTLPGSQPPVSPQLPIPPAQEEFIWDGVYEVKESISCTVIYPEGSDTTTDENNYELEVKNNHIVFDDPDWQIVMNKLIDDFGKAQLVRRTARGVGAEGEVLYNDEQYIFSKDSSGEATLNLVATSYYIPQPPSNPPCPITGSGRRISR